MKKEIFEIGEKTCVAFYEESPEALLIQPADEHEMYGLEHQAELIAAGSDISVLLAAFRVTDWNRELSPWKAPAVFGPEPFGDGAEMTLEFILKEFLPSLREKYSLPEELPVILGGYSLAGFFSLWSAYQTDAFSAVAAVSPSVWFTGWIEYAGTHSPNTRYIDLSLGDKEEKTGNRTMAAVGDRIREQYRMLTDAGIACALEWNGGNHFTEPDVRCAKGFLRCIDAVR